MVGPLAVVGDDPEGLDREEVRFPARGPAQQSSSEPSATSKWYPRCSRPFSVVEHPPEGLGVEFEAELLGLEGQGRAAGHLRDHEPGPVADRVGRDVLVGVRRRAMALVCRPALWAKAAAPT